MCKLITMTQGMIEAQLVQFWYGILNKELSCQMWDAMLIQHALPTLANVFNY